MKCFDEVADRIEAAKINYKALGPNSNTVVTTLLKLCGVPLIKPPGWFVGSNDFLPGFSKSGQQLFVLEDQQIMQSDRVEPLVKTYYADLLVL